MEKIASDLEVSELKQRSLSKAYETLHSQASSMQLLTIQWKDLQEHFDSIRNTVRTRFQELQERQKQLEAEEANLKLETESKKDELVGVQKLIDEKVQEVIKHGEEIELEEKRVLEVHKLVVDKEKECSLIERRIQERTKKLNWVERRIEEKSKEVESKEKELNKYLEECKVKVEQLSVIDKAIVERNTNIEERIKSKEEKLHWIEKGIEKTSKLAKSKEEEVRVIQRSLNVYRESIKSRESELDEVLESIEGKKKEFDVKEEQIKTLQRLIEGCDKELKMKEEKLKGYSLRFRPMEEWSCKLEFKERAVELKEKQIESKWEEFKKWVEERGKDLNSLSSELKAKELQLKREAEELELTKKQCDLATNVIVSSPESDQFGINITDGRSLQLFVYEHMERNDSMSNKISSFLQQESSEPAKLVLDAMQGFYPSNVENKEFDLVLTRRTCILLLEVLKRVSPQINPELRGEAMKLASDWKAKMKVGSGNWLQVLGFLRLVTTYQITSAYDGKELQSLLDIVVQHEQVTELSKALGTIDKAPANSNICSPVEIEQPESPVEATISSPNLHHTATTIDAGHLQWLQNNQLHEACESALKGIILDLTRKQRLTEAVRLIYTLKLSDKFPPVQILKEYVDKEKKRWSNRTRKKKLLDEKDMITDQHIADLRAIIQCIKDYSLESECPPEEIESQIAVLENFKKQIRLASSLVVQQQQQKGLENVEVPKQEQKVSVVEQQEEKPSNAELQEKVVQKACTKIEEQQQRQEQNASKDKPQELQQQKQGKKRSNITFASRFDQQQCKTKIQRTSISADHDNPCELHPDHPGCPNPGSST